MKKLTQTWNQRKSLSQSTKATVTEEQTCDKAIAKRFANTESPELDFGCTQDFVNEDFLREIEKLEQNGMVQVTATDISNLPNIQNEISLINSENRFAGASTSDFIKKVVSNKIVQVTDNKLESIKRDRVAVRSNYFQEAGTSGLTKAENRKIVQLQLSKNSISKSSNNQQSGSINLKIRDGSGTLNLTAKENQQKYKLDSSAPGLYESVKPFKHGEFNISIKESDFSDLVESKSSGITQVQLQEQSGKSIKSMARLGDPSVNAVDSPKGSTTKIAATIQTAPSIVPLQDKAVVVIRKSERISQRVSRCYSPLEPGISHRIGCTSEPVPANERAPSISIGRALKETNTDTSKIVTNIVKAKPKTDQLSDSWVTGPVSKRLLLSTWGLPQSVVQQYKAMGVSQMFEWQADCLSIKSVLRGGNLVYSAPTSSGKTLVAELLMFKCVLERKKKVIMILPFVSVAHEKVHYLQHLSKAVGVRTGGYMGNLAPPGGFQAVDIAVCTIEKANGLINRLIEDNNLHLLGMVVVDELHMVGDVHRGYLLELLLTKILYLQWKIDRKADSIVTLSQTIQIVGMSATLPNLDLLAHWLRSELFCSDFRPVPLIECIKIGRGIYQADSSTKPLRLLDPSPAIKTDADHVIQLCLETVCNGHGVLVFCPSKNWCETLALSIARAIYELACDDAPPSTDEQANEWRRQLRANLQAEAAVQVLDHLRRSPAGLDTVLAKTVSCGVAFHHAGLTFDERDIIEGSFRMGGIKVLTATSTLSSGVNLPARRVIIRTPNFCGGALLNVQTYRQMIGRAGRKGLDTEGESILICKEGEKARACTLVGAELPHIRSCLLEGDSSIGSSMKRALLEAVVSGAAVNVEEVRRYVSFTMWAASMRREDEADQCDPGAGLAHRAIEECLKYLEENEFIRKQVIAEETTDSCTLFAGTSLGHAVLASSLPPEQGLTVFRDLSRARRNFVLENDLHIVYQVTPLITDQWYDMDWQRFLRIWERLPADMRRVAECVGVSERYLVCATRVHGVAKTTDISDKQQAVHLRFYTALALHDLIGEVPLATVANKFGCNRGMLQSLQQSAATFSGMVTAFCHQLGWTHLELLLNNFQSRLHFGIQQELCDLVQHSCLNGQRARVLFDAGYKTVAALAGASILEVEHVLQNAGPFESGRQMEGETESEARRRLSGRTIWMPGQQGITLLEAARAIVDEAREILAKQVGDCNIVWKKTDENVESADMLVVARNRISTITNTTTTRNDESQDICIPNQKILVTKKNENFSVNQESNIPHKGVCLTTTIVPELEESKYVNPSIITKFHPVLLVKNDKAACKRQDQCSRERYEGSASNVAATKQISETRSFTSKIEPVSVKLENTKKTKEPDVEDSQVWLDNFESEDLLVPSVQVFTASRVLSDGIISTNGKSEESIKIGSNVESSGTIIQNVVSKSSVCSPEMKMFASSEIISVSIEKATLSTVDLVEDSLVLLANNTKDNFVPVGIDDKSATPHFEFNNDDSLDELLGNMQSQMVHTASPLLKNRVLHGDGVPASECIPHTTATQQLRLTPTPDGTVQTLRLSTSSTCSDLPVDDHEANITLDDSAFDDDEISIGSAASPPETDTNKRGTDEQVNSEDFLGAFVPPTMSEMRKHDPAAKNLELLNIWPTIPIHQAENSSVSSVHDMRVNKVMLLGGVDENSGNQKRECTSVRQLPSKNVDNHRLKSLIGSSVHQSQGSETGWGDVAVIDEEQQNDSEGEDSFIPSTPPKCTEASTSNKTCNTARLMLPTSEKNNFISEKTTFPTLKKNNKNLFHPTPHHLTTATIQSVNVIDVPLDVVGFTNFINTLSLIKKFSISFACSPLNDSPGSGRIGNHILQNGASQLPTIKMPSVTLHGREMIVEGLAVCWDKINAHYIDVTAIVTSKKEFSKLNHPKITTNQLVENLSTIFRPSEGAQTHVVVAYNLKDQYQVLYELCAFLPYKCRGCDPRIAGWLLQDNPNEKLTLPFLVKKFCPPHQHLNDFRETAQAPHLGMLELEGSGLSARERAATEVVTVLPLMGHIMRRLRAIGLHRAFTDIEMQAVVPLLKLELNGIGFNVGNYERDATRLEARLGQLEREAYVLSGRRFSMASPKEVDHVLYTELHLPRDPNFVGLGSPSTVRGGSDFTHEPLIARQLRPRHRAASKIKTNKEVLHQLENIHLLPGLILEWRRLQSALTRIVLPTRRACLFHPELHMHRVHCTCDTETATGRVVLTEPGLQMVPKDFTVQLNLENDHQSPSALPAAGWQSARSSIRRTTVSTMTNVIMSLRSAFVAFSGGLLVSADYSQLELRMLAHLSGDPELVGALNGGADVFRRIAAKWKHHLTVDDVTDSERHQAKQMCYGMIYGIGAKSLGGQLHVEEGEAAIFMESFKAEFPGVGRFIEETVTKCRQLGYVETLYGRRRYLPGINGGTVEQRGHAERQAINSTVQGSAADLVKLAMVAVDGELAKRFPKTRRPHHEPVWRKVGTTSTKQLVAPSGGYLVLEVFDELLYEARHEDIDEVARIVKTNMEAACRLSVEFPVNIKIGPSWGTLKGVVV